MEGIAETAPKEVITTPEAPKKTAAENTTLDLLRQSHTVLRAWKVVYNVEKDKADDAYYYAEQLWCEDKAKWAHGKRRVLSGEWTVEHFDQEMERLKKKQEPVWAILMKKVDAIREKLEVPHSEFKAAEERVKTSLKPAGSVLKMFGKDRSSTAEHDNLHHEYQNKWKQLYKEAEAEYQLLCAWPEGTLTRVKMFRENYLKETTHVIDYVHNRKGLKHDEQLPAVE
jgi:hypothetical protein